MWGLVVHKNGSARYVGTEKPELRTKNTQQQTIYLQIKQREKTLKQRRGWSRMASGHVGTSGAEERAVTSKKKTRNWHQKTVSGPPGLRPPGSQSEINLGSLTLVRSSFDWPLTSRQILVFSAWLWSNPHCEGMFPGYSLGEKSVPKIIILPVKYKGPSRIL